MGNWMWFGHVALDVHGHDEDPVARVTASALLSRIFKFCVVVDPGE
jgi:hypothetical protein